jgi:hypothetical protein
LLFRVLNCLIAFWMPLEPNVVTIGMTTAI